MGNNVTSDPSCGLNFLSTECLRKSSLRSLKTTPNLSRIPSHNEKTAETKNTDISTLKDVADTPDSTVEVKAFPSPDKSPISSLTEKDFRILEILPTERFGKVYLAKKTDDENKLYAMKIICKKRMNNLGLSEAVKLEEEIMSKANHEAIPKLEFTFENDKKIFLVKDYTVITKLSEKLETLHRLSEEITKFYSAEILTILEYLHEELDIIYNDLKLENIVLDPKGHVILNEFAVAKRSVLDILSPTKARLSKMTDFWQFGCLLYQVLTGHKDLENTDNGSEVNLKWPASVSMTARDLITRLLNPKVEERLGYHGIDEIKKHGFFAGTKWTRIEHRKVYPPITPKLYNKKDSNKEEMGSMRIHIDSTEVCELDEIIENRNRFFTPDIVIGKVFDWSFVNHKSPKKDHSGEK